MITHDIPNSWKWVRCQDVVDVRDGTHDTPLKRESGVPLITSKNLKSGGIDFQNVTYISEEDHLEIERRSGVDDGDILFAMIGTIGNSIIVKKDRPFSIKNVALFKFKGSSVCSNYFNALLSSPIVGRQLEKNSKGGNQKFVSLGVLRDMQIPLPPLPEQRRIAAILDKAHAIRRKRQQAIRLTEESLRSVFVDMFGDPVLNPKGWPEKRLDEISEIQSGITKGRKANGQEMLSVPYMRVANVQDGHIDLGEIKEIEATSTEIARYLLKKGDILLTEGGDPDKLGRGAVWHGEIDPCIHQNHIFRVRPNTEFLLPEYASAQIGSIRGKKYFLKSAKQTTGIASINKTQLSGFPALIPPVTLQEKFVAIVRKQEELLVKNSEAASKKDDCFNSLVQRAFRGDF